MCTSEQKEKFRREKISGYIISISVDMFMLVGKNWLKNYYGSFEQFNSSVCWCCLRKKLILDEFEKKGFYTFNSHMNCWKVYDFLNCFEILPCVETTDS